MRNKPSKGCVIHTERQGARRQGRKGERWEEGKVRGAEIDAVERLARRFAAWPVCAAFWRSFA